MNYIEELNGFDAWLETNEISTSAIVLWFAIMQTANRARWKNPLTIAISTLEQRSGLKRDAIYRARNRLMQHGLISIRERSGRQSAEYTIISFASDKTTQTATQAATQTAIQPTTQAATNRKRNKTKLNTTPITPKGADEPFDRFWQAYPRKAGKDAARKAFKRRKPNDELLDIMLAAIETQKGWEQWQRDGGQYIPNPSTWITQARWEDEPIKTISAEPQRQINYYQGGEPYND